MLSISGEARVERRGEQCPLSPPASLSISFRDRPHVLMILSSGSEHAQRMSQNRRKSTTGRTNSLGYAKVDCHTCKELKRHCDRQRPRCGTCIKSHRKCDGFAIDLTWSDRDQVYDVGAQEIHGGRPKRGFKFVRGDTRAKRKANDRSKNRHRSSKNANGQLPMFTTLDLDSQSYDFEDSAVTEVVITPISSQSPHSGDFFEVPSMEVIQSREDFPPTPSSILFNDLAHKMGPVLDMCKSNES